MILPILTKMLMKITDTCMYINIVQFKLFKFLCAFPYKGISVISLRKVQKKVDFFRQNVKIHALKPLFDKKKHFLCCHPCLSTGFPILFPKGVGGGGGQS